MIKFIFLTLISVFIFLPCFAAENIQLSPFKEASLMLNKNYPKLYKPTNVEIGQKTVFKIVAAPKSHVILGLSTENKGAKDFQGKMLRLGQDYKMIEALVPDNGVLNIEYEMDKDKKLVEKNLFIEAFVYQKDNNNLQIAKIIGANGQEIEYNGIEIRECSNANGTILYPDIPGVNPDSIEAIKNSSEAKSKNSDALQYEKYYNADYTDYTPVYIRNMKSLNIKEKIDGEKN